MTQFRAMLIARAEWIFLFVQKSSPFGLNFWTLLGQPEKIGFMSFPIVILFSTFYPISTRHNNTPAARALESHSRGCIGFLKRQLQRLTSYFQARFLHTYIFKYHMPIMWLFRRKCQAPQITRNIKLIIHNAMPLTNCIAAATLSFARRYEAMRRGSGIRINGASPKNG